MALVDAYDIQTGKKLPYLVPEEHFDHPKLGKRIAPLPSNAAVAKNGQVEDPKPAVRSVEEAHTLKGAALDEALDAVPLPKNGTADEKRARLAEHRATQQAGDVTVDDPDDPVNTETPDANPGDADPNETPGPGEN